MQGIPSGFALTALANYLVGRGLPAAAVGSFVSVVGLPWILQLVWGPLIDRYRYSVVGHYIHWIVLTQWAAAGASLVLVLVQDPAVQTGLLGALFFAHSVVASVQDASVDAMAILITPERERGRVNAFMRGGLLLGISFGAAALSVVLHRYGFRVAVGVQSALLVIFSLLFFVTKLHRADPLLPRFGQPATSGSRAEEPSLRNLFGQLGAALINRLSLRIFGVIGLSYLSFAVFIRSLNFYLIRTLHWSDQDLSVLTGGWGSLTTLAVVFAGGYLADRLGPGRLQIRVLLVLAIFLIGFNVLLFTLTNRTLITAGLLFWGIADPLYSIAAFPILMTLCRKEIAGSQFTAYMALINLSDIGGAYASGWLLEVVPGPVLGLSAGLVLLILLGWLARRQNKEAAV